MFAKLFRKRSTKKYTFSQPKKSNGWCDVYEGDKHIATCWSGLGGRKLGKKRGKMIVDALNKISK